MLLTRTKMVYQKTIRHPEVLEGIGLHTGKPARLTFKPAEPGEGITFVRSDLPGRPSVRAVSKNVQATDMATVLGNDVFMVSTVEHCMSAVGAHQIDNLVIELSGPEIPIGDGSARTFFETIESVGIVEQPSFRKYLYVTEPIYYMDGEKKAYVLPYNGFKITCSIEFPHPKIGQQEISLDISKDNFARELATARTFGFLKDVEALQKKGLALGGSLENAIVLDEEEILNPEGLRFADEFVRHKAMDAMGDILLLGHPLVGHFILHKAGHDVMHGFVKKIAESQDSYRIVELGEKPLAQPTELDLYESGVVS